MEARTKWTVAGLAWGLVAAWAAALAVVGTGAGVFWLWVFGDDPWPAWTEPALLWTAAAAAAVALAATVLAGRALGRRLEREGSSWAHRGAHLALAGAVLVGGAIVARHRAEHAERVSRRAARQRAGSYLERLRPSVEVRLTARPDEVRLAAAGEDAAGGRYVARGELVGDYAPDATLWSGSDTVDLGIGPNGRRRLFRVAVTTDSVRRHFAGRRISRAGARWEAEVGLEARVVLTPLPPPPGEEEGAVSPGAWNALLQRHRGASPADTARVGVTLRSGGDPRRRGATPRSSGRATPR